ncbi:MAG: hypothetical protein K6F52_00760, partial [Clostridia bacterium]|nr:hypothetical protein [Clostridia bacterium]
GFRHIVWVDCNPQTVYIEIGAFNLKNETVMTTENRQRPKAVSILFILFIFAGLALCLLIPDRAFSENENRPLEEFPELSFETISDGSFMAKFEKYAADQMPGRDFFMAAAGRIMKAAGETDNGRVYFGKDGYLFSADKIDERQLEKNTEYAVQFLKKIKSRNPEISTSVLIAPTAAYIEKDKLPAHLTLQDQEKIMKGLQEKFGTGFCNVIPELKKHSDEYIYFRTDHHWTAAGACYAYGVWAQKNGFAKKSPGDYKETVLSENFLGTNFSKAGFAERPDALTALLPQGGGEILLLAGNSPEELMDDLERLEKSGEKEKRGMVPGSASGDAANAKVTVNGSGDAANAKVPVNVSGDAGGMKETLHAKKVLHGLIDESFLEGKDKYSCFIGGNNPVTVIKKISPKVGAAGAETAKAATKAGNTGAETAKAAAKAGATGGRRLLLVKDSYSHCMVPLLTEIFDEIIAVDLRYYKGSTAKIAEEYNVTDVMLLYNIMQFANERNIVYLLQ